jgi:hypothetical protein
MFSFIKKILFKIKDCFRSKEDKYMIKFIDEDTVINEYPEINEYPDISIENLYDNIDVI